MSEVLGSGVVVVYVKQSLGLLYTFKILCSDWSSPVA